MDNAEQANERIQFQLTYGRAVKRRNFIPGWLEGEDIDDAWNPGVKSPGEWMDGREEDIDTNDRSVEEWIDRYATYAIGEVVHEALEWYRVDGQPWLNPHGPAEDAIHDLTNRFADELVALRARWMKPTKHEDREG